MILNAMDSGKDTFILLKNFFSIKYLFQLMFIMFCKFQDFLLYFYFTIFKEDIYVLIDIMSG